MAEALLYLIGVRLFPGKPERSSLAATGTLLTRGHFFLNAPGREPELVVAQFSKYQT
jgi:hypothetical protein